LDYKYRQDKSLITFLLSFKMGGKRIQKKYQQEALSMLDAYKNLKNLIPSPRGEEQNTKVKMVDLWRICHN